MKNQKIQLLTLLVLLFLTASLPGTAFAISGPGGPPGFSQPPDSATRPSVVGSFIAGGQNLTPGQIGLNFEHARFDAAFNFSGTRINPPGMTINTYDLFGAVSDKLVLGFGASGGEIIDTYGKYKVDKNFDLLFGKKKADKNIDVYCQYKFAFPVTAFVGTRGFASSPVSSVDTSGRLLYGLSAFLPLSKTAGIHSMVAATNKSREWQVGLDKKINKNLSASIQYRAYRENGDNSSTFKLKGIGFDLSYLF